MDQVKGVKVGSWSSINVIDVKCDESKLKWTYKITTSVVLEMNIDSKQTGDFNVNGSLTKTVYNYYYTFIYIHIFIYKIKIIIN